VRHAGATATMPAEIDTGVGVLAETVVPLPSCP
jgi:hypothetical protein